MECEFPVMDVLLHPLTSPPPSPCYTIVMLTTMVTRHMHSRTTTGIDSRGVTAAMRTELSSTMNVIGTKNLLRPWCVLMQLWTHMCYGNCLVPGTWPTLLACTVLHLLLLCPWTCLPVVPVSVPWLGGIRGCRPCVRVRPTPGAGWFPLMAPVGDLLLIGLRVPLPPKGPYATTC